VGAIPDPLHIDTLKAKAMTIPIPHPLAFALLLCFTLICGTVFQPVQAQVFQQWISKSQDEQTVAPTPTPQQQQDRRGRGRGNRNDEDITTDSEGHILVVRKSAFTPDNVRVFVVEPVIVNWPSIFAVVYPDDTVDVDSLFIEWRFPNSSDDSCFVRYTFYE
jgi:hypothetical protein